MSDNTIYTLQDLATHWKCDVRVLRDMIHAKKLKAFLVGREYRITAAEVERIESATITI